MSFIEEIFGFTGRLKIGEIAVDASVSEQHILEGEVTDHPVEEGSDITDHYRVKPRGVQINGVITNTPLATGFPAQTLINSVKALKAGGTPVKDAWSTVKGYFSDGTLITISTSLDDYPNIVLTSFKATRDSKNGQNLNFSCVARQLRIVTTEITVGIVIPKTTTASKTKSKAKGRKPPKAANAAKSKSSLAKIVDKGISFFR